MAETDRMTIDERRKYIHKVWGRYRDAPKSEKSRLLDEAEAVTGLHRKSIVRILNGHLSRKKREKQRGRHYGCELEDVLLIIALSLDYPCAERLKPNLPWMAEHLASYGELKLDEDLLEQLAKVSISTIKRMLKQRGKAEAKLAFRKPPSQRQKQLSKLIPIQRIDWQMDEPGHFEVDLVHHCGPSSGGLYACSLQMVDVATGWSEVTVTGTPWPLTYKSPAVSLIAKTTTALSKKTTIASFVLTSVIPVLTVLINLFACVSYLKSSGSITTSSYRSCISRKNASLPTKPCAAFTTRPLPLSIVCFSVLHCPQLLRQNSWKLEERSIRLLSGLRLMHSLHICSSCPV